MRKLLLKMGLTNRQVQIMREMLLKMISPLKLVSIVSEGATRKRYRIKMVSSLLLVSMVSDKVLTRKTGKIKKLYSV